MPNVSRDTATERITWRGSTSGTSTSRAATRSASSPTPRTPTSQACSAACPTIAAQLPRWGYVIEGRVGFRFADREETYEAGEAYYVGARPHPGPLRRHRDRRVQPHATCSGRRSRWCWNLDADGIAVEMRQGAEAEVEAG